jgi:hypothetical protein
MPSSAFSKITGALVQLLDMEPPIADVIYRARSRVVPQSVFRAINVQFNGGMPAPGAITGAPVDWTSKFSIECFARAATSENNDEAVDPLLMAVYSRIAADTTLGGLVDNVGEPLIEAEYSADGERTGWICMTYPIEHRTQQSTLE